MVNLLGIFVFSYVVVWSILKLVEPWALGRFPDDHDWIRKVKWISIFIPPYVGYCWIRAWIQWKRLDNLVDGTEFKEAIYRGFHPNADDDESD